MTAFCTAGIRTTPPTFTSGTILPHADILHQGYAILPPAGQNAFEIQVPSDDYQVTVVAGDSQTTNTHYRINVEGVLTVDGYATAQNPWVTGTQIVTVRDGRLTISSAAGAGTNKIDYIDIVPWDNATTVSVAPEANLPTTAPHGGGFVFTRQGSVTDPQTYDYLIGGSASEGHDYAGLSGIVFFPPAQRPSPFRSHPISTSSAARRRSWSRW